MLIESRLQALFAVLDVQCHCAYCLLNVSTRFSYEVYNYLGRIDLQAPQFLQELVTLLFQIVSSERHGLPSLHLHGIMKTTQLIMLVSKPALFLFGLLVENAKVLPLLVIMLPMRKHLSFESCSVRIVDIRRCQLVDALTHVVKLMTCILDLLRVGRSS